MDSRQTQERHAAFARRHFSGCDAHIEEAAAVHRVLELLLRSRVADLSPDAPLAEILDGVGRRSADSLDTVEYVMSLEEEIGVSVLDGGEPGSWEAAVRRALLGPAAARSTWTDDALTCRSVREVVEERVRLRGDCRCRQPVHFQ